MKNLNYTGTLVTRCRTTGHTDAFSFSGFTSFRAVCDHLAQRVRNPNCELRSLVGVCVEDSKHVSVFQFTADECVELAGRGLLDDVELPRKRR